MAEKNNSQRRKPLSQKARFEVFKRDKFTCQYCGRMAPEVILEVDHIKPVASGGTNDLINLITSCRECNRGKGRRRLSDNSEILVQSQQLKDLADQKEQLEMMVKWREELLAISELQVNSICEFINTQSTKWAVADGGRRTIANLVKKFGYSEVYTSAEISFEKYFNGSEASWEKALAKIGGVCYNRSIGRGPKDYEK